jgi:hypothetical protein
VRRRHRGRGVESAAEADLEHGGLGAMLGEVEAGRREQGLEKRHFAVDRVEDPFDVRGEFSLLDERAVDGDPLAHRLEVRRQETAGAQARGAKDAVHETGGRALALRPGDLDDARADPSVRRAEPLEQPGRAREVEIPRSVRAGAFVVRQARQRLQRLLDRAHGRP